MPFNRNKVIDGELGQLREVHEKTLPQRGYWVESLEDDTAELHSALDKAYILGVNDQQIIQFFEITGASLTDDPQLLARNPKSWFLDQHDIARLHSFTNLIQVKLTDAQKTWDFRIGMLWNVLLAIVIGTSLAIVSKILDIWFPST